MPGERRAVMAEGATVLFPEVAGNSTRSFKGQEVEGRNEEVIGKRGKKHLLDFT